MKRFKMRHVLFVCILLGIIAMLGLFFMKKDSAQEPTVLEEKISEQEDTPVEEEIPDMFPCELEDGKLKVMSLFPASVSNPDGDGTYVENLASIELINLSEEHLKNAKITLTLEDGQTLNFVIEEIPAGSTVWGFEVENQSVLEECVCEEIKCEASFEEETTLLESSLEIKAEGTNVSVTNLLQDDIENMEISFHCWFDGVFFGGKTYNYVVEKIAPEETTVLDVWECYMGEAQAVYVEN